MFRSGSFIELWFDNEACVCVCVCVCFMKFKTKSISIKKIF